MNILGPDGETIHSFRGEGTSSENLDWETNLPNIADITYSFEGRDMAGNTLVLKPRSLEGKLATEETSPSGEEQKKKEWDYDF